MKKYILFSRLYRFFFERELRAGILQDTEYRVYGEYDMIDTLGHDITHGRRIRSYSDEMVSISAVRLFGFWLVTVNVDGERFGYVSRECPSELECE